ncbi:hypothetical protein FE257_011566 [Aspergillus nanangensis]|uniref:Uncharacterized protein n=1 Tax=Aspergillus nanangensis TaxID=2582783 RepID=A0AAD4CIN9_ASPNN|nr:hypothetical protein FE257_011566 [Aspergillus nanangensis]
MTRKPISKLYGILIPQPPCPLVLPLQSVWQPAALHTPNSVRNRLNSSLSKGWEGSKAEDHTVNRAKRHDTTDPSTAASSSGMKDRMEAKINADDSKPQGTTERGGSEHQRKAKKEHPKAPEPIIGMNDERGRAPNLKNQTR